MVSIIPIQIDRIIVAVIGLGLPVTGVTAKTYVFFFK